MSRKKVFNESSFIYLEVDKQMKDDLQMYVENYKMKTGDYKSVNQLIRELITNKIYESLS